MFNLKTYAFPVASGLGFATFSAGSAFAQNSGSSVEFIDIGVSAGDVASSVGSTVGPWVLGALGVAGTIFAVKLGWKLIRGFVNRS